MSFANLFASSLQTLANIHGKDDGTLHSTLSFFGGIVLILLIDKLIPHIEGYKHCYTYCLCHRHT